MGANSPARSPQAAMDQHELIRVIALHAEHHRSRRPFPERQGGGDEGVGLPIVDIAVAIARDSSMATCQSPQVSPSDEKTAAQLIEVMTLFTAVLLERGGKITVRPESYARAIQLLE